MFSSTTSTPLLLLLLLLLLLRLLLLVLLLLLRCSTAMQSPLLATTNPFSVNSKAKQQAPTCIYTPSTQQQQQQQEQEQQQQMMQMRSIQPHWCMHTPCMQQHKIDS